MPTPDALNAKRGTRGPFVAHLNGAACMACKAYWDQANGRSEDYKMPRVPPVQNWKGW